MSTSLTERFWTIPNILSLYRIIIFPFIFYLVYVKDESLFTVFITISLVTDILDGLIARAFKMQTQIGVKLDSLADIGTTLLAFLAIYVLKWEQVKPHAFAVLIFFIAWLLAYLIAIIRFGGLVGLHTYLFKITGYLQGAFIVTLFVFNFNLLLFYFAVIVGIIASVEEIIIVSIIPKPISNVKGLYWLLKNRS
ncbi:MAG: CDP-alcohol phosphatidyltransferase family protein [Segetibacter sp.]|nr:CDP-alcohol phosphatidyltransferase family protein [Segetibacter sp.]